MITKEEKYRNDVEFRSLVDILESYVHSAKYTPSEIREACILACIHHEMHHIQIHTFPAEKVLPEGVVKSLKEIDSWIKSASKQ